MNCAQCCLSTAKHLKMRVFLFIHTTSTELPGTWLGHLEMRGFSFIQATSIKLPGTWLGQQACNLSF